VLQDSDLEAFLNAYEASATLNVAPVQPSIILQRDDGLFPSEVWRLICSLQIAAVLGEAPQSAAVAAQVILDDLSDVRCAPLLDQQVWSNAIAWALEQPALYDPTSLRVSAGRERERIVGEACLRLRRRGYHVNIGAYGPQVSEASRREIVRSIETFIGLIGGLETANQALRYLHDAKFHHDGIWLFGEVGLAMYQPKRPMLPVGWLLSLALRKLSRPGSARKPAVAWKSLVELATDFAAVHDCQRYNQFDGMNLHPSQFHRTLLNSTLWRELFTLPQMPAKALHQVFDALAAVLTRDDNAQLGFAARDLLTEILRLLERSADDRITMHPRTAVEGFLPILRRLSGGAAEAVNASYGDPLTANGRTQDNTLLFACGRDRAITLPRAFLAEAACEFVFELIWSKLGRQRAATVVGETLERAIAAACENKATTVLAHQHYRVGRRQYELDVATRDGDRIVLIETKGKMLTRQSRSGDMFAAFRDYSDSFLRMLSQLVRHEVQLRQGHIRLTAAEEKVDDLRPVKVAVSPLSYGPVSDKSLSSSLLRSLVGAKFAPIIPDEANQRMIDVFNQRLQRIFDDIPLVAPKKEGAVEIFPYLMDVFWLDVGQLLYILDRANTVWDAFRPLTHVTFSSRDFWTELAHADRAGLTANYWRQLARL
jgi:hypothetical protein